MCTVRMLGTVCLPGCGWVNWRRRRMDCDSGSDSGSRGQSGSSALGQLTCTYTKKTENPKAKELSGLRSTLSGPPARLAWLPPLSHSRNHWTRPPLRAVRAGKGLWAHVRQQHCQTARLANRAAARSDSWVALAKAGCPSLGQGCRKSGLILMVKSPGFLHEFRDMSVWSVWLFRSAGCLLSSSSSSIGRQRQQEAAGSQLLLSLLAHSHFSCLGGSSRCLAVSLPVSLYCTTGLNHQISPFLTASNGVHPPIRRPVDVPSLPNHKPSIIQSSPIGAPRKHSLTNLSHPLTRLKQTH